MAKRKSTESESNSGFDVNAMLEELNKQEEVRPSQTDGPEAAHLHPGQFYDERWHMWFDKPQTSKSDVESTKVTVVDSVSTIPEKKEPDALNLKVVDASQEISIDSPNVTSMTITNEEESERIDEAKISTTKAEEDVKATEESIIAIAPTDVTEVIEVTKVETQPEQTSAESASKETSPPKATRISAKMRRASREEFCETYLKKCDTKFGKPITIEAPLMPRLYRICLLTGDRKACPTSLINNLIKEILPTLEKDAERW